MPRRVPFSDWQKELEASTVSQLKEANGRRPVRAPGLTLLHHPEPRRIGEVAPLVALRSGRKVPLSRLEPSFSQPRDGAPRPLADTHLSRRPLWLGPAETLDGFSLDPADSPTALSIDGELVHSVIERPWMALDEGLTLRLADRLVLLLHWIDPTPDPAIGEHGLVGESVAIMDLRREIQRASRSDSSVLLRGETGTGKELVALAIHRSSPRSQGPFVAVNMAAIPPSLAAAELFGAAKGAYTGATSSRRGYFRQAEGGTLFLDEIGEAPNDLQTLLLRALETREIRPVGQERSEPVDLRILAATDADLEARVSEGDFRAPLVHRLAGFELRLPPLRHRRDDIGRLLLHFLRQELDALGAPNRLAAAGPEQRPWLPAWLIERLARFSWPGNVRQLRNLACQLAARFSEVDEIAQDPWIDELLAGPRSDRPAGTVSEAGDALAAAEPRGEWHGRPSEISRQILRKTLREHCWSLKPTAKALGISRTSLYTLIHRHGLRHASQVSRRELEQGLERHGGDLEALAAELEVSVTGLRHRRRALSRGDSERDP